MKIILSRKGFDSENGGCASPIFPDGRLLSLPIPASKSPTTFDKVNFDDLNVGNVVEQLTKRRIRRSHFTHLDPDINCASIPREKDWRPAFGQANAAQKHLQNFKIGKGDLFIFFGWFREVEKSSAGNWRFNPRAPNLHVIYGWLQVDNVLTIGNNTEKFASGYPWLSTHPHLHDDFGAENNTIYIASEHLSIGNQSSTLNMPGGGVFSKVNRNLTLTDQEQHLRSVWYLPSWFYPYNPNRHRPPLSYHGKPNRWLERNNGSVGLQTVGKGQEFVLDIEHYPEATEWLKGLFS